MPDQQAREISVDEAYKFIADELSADNPKLIAGAEKLKKEHPGKMKKAEFVQGMWKQIPELGEGFSLSGVSNVGQTPQKSDKPPGADKPKDQPPGAEKKGFLSSMGEVINPLNVAKGLVAPYTNLYHEAKQLLGDMTGDQPGASKGAKEFLHKWTEPTPEAPPLKEVAKRIAYGTPVVGESIRDIAEEGNYPAAAGHLAGNLVLLAVLRKFGIKAGEGAAEGSPKLESAYKEWRDSAYSKGKRGHYEDKSGNVHTEESLREQFRKAVAEVKSGKQEQPKPTTPPTKAESNPTAKAKAKLPSPSQPAAPPPPEPQPAPSSGQLPEQTPAAPPPPPPPPPAQDAQPSPVEAPAPQEVPAEAPKTVEPAAPATDPQADMRAELERLKAENEKLKAAPQEEPAKPKRQTAKSSNVQSGTPPGSGTNKPPAKVEPKPAAKETPPGAKPKPVSAADAMRDKAESRTRQASGKDTPPGAKPKPKSLDAADPDPVMIKKGKYTESSFNAAQDALLEHKMMGHRYVTITPMTAEGKVAGPGVPINAQEYSTGALEDVAEKLHVPKFHHVKVDIGRVVPKE